MGKFFFEISQHAQEKHLYQSLFFNAKFPGKYLCQSLFFNTATLLKKRLRQICFPLYFVKFLRTPFLRNTHMKIKYSDKGPGKLKIEKSTLLPKVIQALYPSALCDLLSGALIQR